MSRATKRTFTTEAVSRAMRFLQQSASEQNFICKSDRPMTVYSLIMKRGTNRAQFRFFMVCSGVLIEVTSHVAAVTGFTLMEASGGEYFYIWTHSTNAQDVVVRLGEKLFGDGRNVIHERL